jgi:hypothetical protein
MGKGPLFKGRMYGTHASELLRKARLTCISSTMPEASVANSYQYARHQTCGAGLIIAHGDRYAIRPRFATRAPFTKALVDGTNMWRDSAAWRRTRWRSIRNCRWLQVVLGTCGSGCPACSLWHPVVVISKGKCSACRVLCAEEENRADLQKTDSARATQAPRRQP